MQLVEARYDAFLAAEGERRSKLVAEVRALNGDGLNSALLAEANIGKSDVILAVTDDDKTNMLAAVRAKMSGCPRSIVLINDPSLVPLMAPLGFFT